MSKQISTGSITNYSLFSIILLLLFMVPKITSAGETDSVKVKIDKILSQLSLDEKISMLHANSKFTISGIERLGIPDWAMSDGPHGVREEINRHDWEPAGWDDDFATYLPAGTALGATWNTNLAFEFGTVLGREARARNKDVILGPGVNIIRTPLGGRNFEYISEDPYLSKSICVPYIKAVQEQDVAACVKHYALNNQEHERFLINTIVDERTLREIYLPSFESAVKEAEVLTIMSAYNKVNGKWCSENPKLLNQILKKEWNFDGVVISDWNGTHSTVDAALAGLDIEMGTNAESYEDYYFADQLKEAVLNGDVDINIIDDKVRRILTAMYKTKVFDENRSRGEFISDRNFAVAKKVAQEAVVLLKNENKILPLNKNNIKKIAVIGENAIVKHAAGGGSSGVKTKYEITPLEGLKNQLNDKVEITFSEGYRTYTTFDWEDGVVDTSLQNAEYKNRLRNDAVEAAKSADYVLMFIGLNHHHDNESADRKDMHLPYGQDQLIKEVLKVNKNTIVISIGGSPIDVSEWVDSVPAIIQGWYAGSEAGNVFAEIIFGDVNPSGKLPFTFPKKLEDSPAHKIGDYPGENQRVEYKEGIFVGYRYFDTFGIEPQFAFGHGLSYTDFSYSALILNESKIHQSEDLDLSIKIKNVGNLSGSEVIQLYIEDIEASVERPKKELKGYKKIHLNVGEEKEVVFKIDEKMFSFYDTELNNWKAEPGKFRIHIGSASNDIRLSAIIEYVVAENNNY